MEPPGGGPSQLVLYAVLQLGTTVPDDLGKRFQQAIRSELNPLFKVSDVKIVDVRQVGVATLPEPLQRGGVQLSTLGKEAAAGWRTRTCHTCRAAAPSTQATPQASVVWA